MTRIEKTVFISYRRNGGSGWALAIAQNLTHNGFDVFFDYLGIGSGDFGQVIRQNIEARAHFLVLLTPSALERVDVPGDWLRREIETALDTKRNIVPLMLEGFDFSTPSISGRLTGTIERLKDYNGLTIPPEYFDEAMTRLRTRHLNVPVDAVLRPPSQVAKAAAATQQVAADSVAVEPQRELTADQWFERGYAATDPDEKLRCYSEVIRLRPNSAAAFYNRGNAHKKKGDVAAALGDYDEAIRLKPDHQMAHVNRGNARSRNGDLVGAIEDYTTAIRLQPDDAEAFYNRANARREKSDLAGALNDFDEAIRLRPNYANAFYNRGNLRKAEGDRAGAAADYQTYLALGGGVRDGDQKAVEEMIRALQL